MKLAKRIEQLFKDRCAEFKEEWHYKKVRPSEENIKKEMLEIAKKELGRELKEEEKIRILKYKSK